MKQQNAITLMIGGAAGAGIKSVEKLLVKVFQEEGFFLFSSKEYMSRIRGGTNTVQIRISDTPVTAATWKTDLYCALDSKAIPHANGRFHKKSIVLGEDTGETMPSNWKELSFREVVRELGGKQYISTYAAGVILEIIKTDPAIAIDITKKLFADRDPDANIEALKAGMERGRGLGLELKVPARPDKKPENLYMDGTTACGFGFLAGGCNFTASYPMSPSTGVLNFMAESSKHLNIAVEQAEDEIAAFNMVLGAWYGGGKGLTTTSGGGFALMGEGMSLAGMTETPAVVYLAQRPGPATGLPTRSEQGDLELALYSGHGEFPRIILAPGDTNECIGLGHLAFERAAAFQSPVILLSDQYLADAVQETVPVDFEAFVHTDHIIATDGSYRRYALTDNGISPRGVPGYGEGLVCCDSDEHDERGQITERHEVRDAMVAKRRHKHETILESAVPPEITGEGEVAIIGWGSTKGVIAEALARLDDPRLFQVHFSWIYPLPPSHLQPLQKTQRNIVIENNSNAQFAALLQRYGIKTAHNVLQSNGFPFFADQLAQRLEKILKELP